MKKRFYWRDLDDGLLKEPQKIGPYYDIQELNPWDGFDSERQALAALSEWRGRATEWVLVTTYTK
jgi:hypothetical protein